MVWQEHSHSRARPRKMSATDLHRIMDEQRGDHEDDDRSLYP